MKLILLFLINLWVLPSFEDVLLIDPTLKKPVIHTNGYHINLSNQRLVPVIASDKQLLITKCEEAAKYIQTEVACNTPVKFESNHSCISIYLDCNNSKSITVWLTTTIGGTKISIPIVKDEANTRLVQVKLIDFATYLSN